MNRLLHCLFFFVLFYSQAFGQSAAVSGKVTDDKNEPLTGAVVELRNSADSTLAKVNVADASGLFAFENVKAGKYFIRTSLVGFMPHRSESFTYDGTSSKQFPTIK